MADDRSSFFTLEISQPRLLPQAEKAIQEELEGEAGAALSWLHGNTYVLARGAQKALRKRFSDAQLLNILSAAAPGAGAVKRLSADAVMTLYAERRDAEDPTGHFDDEPAPSTPWHFEDLRIREAQAFLRTRPEAIPLETVRLALLDTGYSEHPVFGTWAPDGSHPTIRGDLGKNDREPGRWPLDPYQEDYPGNPGHGTRILSVIAGNSDRLVGVAPGVTVVPYRVTNVVVINVPGNRVPLADALRHAIDGNRCQVINISLGDPCLPGRDNGEAIDEAYDKGAIVVAAAGNMTSEVTYPGKHKRTITAGGSTAGKRPWTGGSRGPRVDVCAPADEVYRANWKKGATGAFEPVYAKRGSGTSFATAHVSGVACLWLARWGAALNIYQDAPWQRVEAFRHVIERTAVVPPGWDTTQFGAGIIDAEAVLRAPLPAPSQLKYETDEAADDLS